MLLEERRFGAACMSSYRKGDYLYCFYPNQKVAPIKWASSLGLYIRNIVV
jgi:hypothetical protein